jgi:hypothetical protein
MHICYLSMNTFIDVMNTWTDRCALYAMLCYSFQLNINRWDDLYSYTLVILFFRSHLQASYRRMYHLCGQPDCRWEPHIAQGTYSLWSAMLCYRLLYRLFKAITLLLLCSTILSELCYAMICIYRLLYRLFKAYCQYASSCVVSYCALLLWVILLWISALLYYPLLCSAIFYFVILCYATCIVKQHHSCGELYVRRVQDP